MFTLLLPLALAQTPADPFAKWEKEISAIEKRLAENPPKPGGVFFAGSSSIRLWDLKKSFPGQDYVNVGFGGSQVRDTTHFAGRILLPHKPRAVVFYAGDNDIAAGRTADQVAADFRTFAAAVHKDLPECRVLWVAVKPSVRRWKKFDEQKSANARVREFVGKEPRTAYVDVVPDMLGADGAPRPELFAADGLHLSPAGYEIWAAKVMAALKP